MAWLRTACISVMMMATALPALAATAFPGSIAPIQKRNISLKDVINTVEDQFKPDGTGFPPLRDVTADFVQASTLIEKGREARASGQMFFRTATRNDPLRFRFDYFSPTNQQIVTDGRTMWVYLPANRQVIQSDVSFVFSPNSFDQRTNRSVNFLQGLGRISQDFIISFSSQVQDIEGNYILQLEPRRRMDTISKLFIVVDRDAVLRRGENRSQELAFPILSTTVVDLQGNTTMMEFSNRRANTGIPLSYFDFIVPPDTQVVRPPTGR